MHTIGDRLARIRGFRRMTQQDVADKSKVRVQNLSRIEQDHRVNIRSDVLLRLALALDCSVDYLMGLRDDPELPRRRRKEPAHVE